MFFFKLLRFTINHPLNRGQKIGSILRFAKWQIASRIAPGPIVYEWINGSKFLVEIRKMGLTWNIYAGLHEFRDMGFLLHVLRSEDLFVDVGANAGAYSILACAAIGARGFAFEPTPDTYKRLVENMRLNHLDERVVCLNKGVGVEQGHLAFALGGDSSMNHVLVADERGTDTTNVEVTTLDASLQGESPFLMKIDVEGYELPVLEGGRQILQNSALHAVIMELNGSGERYGYDESRILELMSDYGFQTFSYNPLTRSLVSLEGKDLHSDNTLFVRDKAFVEERLRNAAKVSVHGRSF